MSSQASLLHTLLAGLCRWLALMLTPASSSIYSFEASEDNVGIDGRSLSVAEKVAKGRSLVTHHQKTSFAVRGALGMVLLVVLPVAAQGATICDHFDCTDTSQTALNLYGFLPKIEGTLPPELADFTSLTIIQLGDLKLSGTIPAEIMKQQLQMLALGSNSFSGTIPINLDEAQSLEKLVLANNKVSGTIPEVVTELPLTSLKLQNNRISGSIPPGIGNLNKIDDLRLFGNSLTGVIPDSFNDLTAAQRCELTPGNGGLRCFDNPHFSDSRACPTEVAKFACEPLKAVISFQYCRKISPGVTKSSSPSLDNVLDYVADTLPDTINPGDIVAEDSRHFRSGRRLKEGRRRTDITRPPTSGSDSLRCYDFKVYVYGEASVVEVLEAIENAKFTLINVDESGVLTPSVRSTPLSVTGADFSCLNFELMTNVRETGGWCYEGGRHADPIACNNSYVTTFPNYNMDPGYYQAPRIYRGPNVREQRQRCVHNGLTGDAAKCNMEEKQYQCPLSTSLNCTLADLNDIRKNHTDSKECPAIQDQDLCEVSYMRTNETWSFGNINGREYKKCAWNQGQGCVQGQAVLKCRDPDDGPKCIDVWGLFVADGQSCGSLATARALNTGENLSRAAEYIGANISDCTPCAIDA